jgi:HEAT repeat protein
VSHDGKTIYFTMAPAGTKFLRIYRIGADGSGLRPLGREGPWHDYEPEPLPDGRIVFSSTRIGSREEYHGNLASALFIMDSEGENIQPLTQHIVADREPRLTANGAIAFIRSDNFLERAKVETHIHQVHLDGTSGIVLMGGDRQAIRYDRSRAAEGNANWLRSYGYGSPAPLPDGRVAAIGTAGVVVTGPATTPRKVPMPFVPFDIAPLPDGRLLCTTPSQDAFGVIDLETGEVARIFQAAVEKVHSVAYLGPRPQPLLTASHVPPTTNHTAEQTGFLLCQNVRVSRQIHADWERIRAVRVYEGRPLAIRPARHPYAHIGVEAIELGTVPLAPDGSFYVQVPADRALAIQLIDGEGRSVINELSWIYVRPGERRSCVGCHAPRAVSPLPMEALAVRANPVDLTLGSRPHRFRGNNAANGGVLNLQLDRFREVASIDLYTFPATSAAAKLSSAKDEKERKEPLLPARQEELQRATQALRSGSTAAKVSAAQRLGILRDRSAAPVLVGALRDPSVEVRVAAALALAACGDRAVVPPLLSALEQAQPLVAQAAHLALEHLTGHTVPFDGFSAEGRRQGAWAWRKWREHHDWPVVEENLIARLNSPAPQTVHLAIEALGHIGGEKARAALRQFLVDHPDGELRTLMAAIRALGHLRDQASVPLLAKLLLPEASADKGKGGGSHELGFTQKPAYLAATAAEALGWIGSPEAQKALLEAFPQLDNFWRYSFQTGDHDWLMGCHSSVVHYRYLEALENLGASELAGIVPHVLRSVPIDTDRGLLLENDTYENLVARLVYRAGLTSVVGETCLALLGEGSAQSHEHWRAAVTTSPPASSCGILCPECRAAHLLSVISVDRRHAAEIRAALARYRAAPDSRKRAWVCFFLARTLGKVRDREAIPLLSESLEKDPAEALLGLIDPPNVFTYRAMTPFYRAAAAHALGAIGDPAAAPLLLRTVADFHNALDVRHSAAQGLALLCRQSCPAEVKTLAPGYPEVSIRRILQRVANGGGP